LLTQLINNGVIPYLLDTVKPFRIFFGSRLSNTILMV